MEFFILFFMLLVVVGLASIDHSFRKKLKNDERIIERLDLIWREMQVHNNNK